MTDNKRLDDFGEHIAGAKKETYFRAIDPTSEKAKTLPLSKLWTDKDIKDIENISIRAIAFALKESLPNKPRNHYKLSYWLDTLHRHQSTVIDLLQKDDVSYTNQHIDKISNSSAKNKAYLLPNIAFEDWKRIGKVAFYQSAGSNGVRLGVEIDNKEYRFFPKEHSTLANFDYKKIIDGFAEEIKQQIEQNKQEKSQNNAKIKELTAQSFDTYTRTKDNTAFICAKTDRQKTPLIEFETLAEAREYKKDPENIAELSRRWTAHREHNSIAKTDMRNAVNEERTGQSYRDHDITPNEFMATFGVRGGQFGNWVTGDERQQMLNSTYDGFMDLSKALKIDPKAIGLNGTLGIAFGARGSGNASAHYERGEQVINLTKTRGAGSLAHEWWHALDHYMKNGDDLLTRHLNATSQARHQELVAPVRELVKAIHKSELYSRSQKADAYRNPAYFATDVEMTARAFEGHIQHTLSKMGIKNDFLVNIRAEKDWQKNLDAYPYPKAKELEKLGKAYNAVFDTLKEVDKEFTPTHYEPEQIIHADTLAVNQENSYSQNIDNAIQGKPLDSAKIWVGNTPQVLQMLGMQDLPVYIHRKTVLKDAIRKHNITADDLKAVPNQLERPIAVMKSAETSSNPNAYLFLTELIERENGKDKPVIAVLSVTQKEDSIEINSVYGRSKSQIERDLNGILYWDSKKGQQFVDNFGYQLPPSLSNADLSYNCKTEKDLSQYILTKNIEKQPFVLDTYLQNNGFAQDIHGIWQKEISGYNEKLMIYGYPNSSLDIRLGDNRSTLIAKMDENISLEEVHQTFTESWYSDLVEWRLDKEKTQDNLEQEHAKQSLNTADEPQAQTASKSTQQPQLRSVANKILINNYLENNGFKKGINVGSYRKQIDDNNLLVVGVANDVSIQSVANNQVKEQETVLSSLAQNLGEDDIKQAFSQSKLWQAHLGQSVQPTIQAEQPTQPTPVAQQQQATAYTPNISQYDTKLNTPYAEKNQAKALGAKWDNANKTWYAPAGIDLNKFEKWLPKEKEQSKQSSDKLANSPAQAPQGQTNAIPQAQRLYLYTRPSDNEKMQELKAQGIIKFDLPNKLWYAHKDNAEAVKEWTTRPNVPTPEQALTDHLRSMGIKVDAGHPIFDERPHRLSNDGSTDKNVMYHAYANPNGVPYARITNFSRNGVSKWTYPAEHLHDLRTIEAVDRAMGQSYTNRPTPTIHTPQTAPQSHNLLQAQQEPPKDEAKIALENLMAERAKMVMSFAPIADNNQNYLDKKQVTANGVAHIVPSSDKIPEHLQSHIAIGNTPKQYFWLLANNPENKLVLQRGNLVIPQYNAQGEMRAFETIAYNGRKYALKDAEKKSMMTVLGSLENGKPIVITEGYATGATLHEHTGRNVVVAFGKNGLMDIAKELRDNYPDSKIYIGADNDHNKEQNYGLQNALAVQGAVKNVYVLAPQFEAGDTGKDWNDVFVNKGVDELKRQLKEQLAQINPHPIQQAQKTIENLTVQATQPQMHSQNPLDPDVIRQNYPTMKDSNIKAIQVWRDEIDRRYANDPAQKDYSLLRLTNALTEFANGKELPLPKFNTVEQKPPEQIQVPTTKQSSVDNVEY